MNGGVLAEVSPRFAYENSRVPFQPSNFINHQPSTREIGCRNEQAVFNSVKACLHLRMGFFLFGGLPTLFISIDVPRRCSEPSRCPLHPPACV